MAKSKNRRKGGKEVKVDHKQRLRRVLAYEVKDLMVCNIVDRREIEDEDLRTTMIPRTLVYNCRLRRVVAITKQQERALRAERWKWNIQTGVVCRKQDGTVYLDREMNTQTITEVLLTEMNDHITNMLVDAWTQANSLHTLTMFWVACPYEIEDIPQEAVLAPMWAFNVTGNMLTQYEQDTPDLDVIHFRTDNFSEYVEWFNHQQKFVARSKIQRNLTYKFVAGEAKMKKGELSAFRQRLIDKTAIEHESFGYEKFNPFATVQGFVNWGEHTGRMNGVQSGTLLSYFEEVPPCLKVYVTMEYDNGDKTEMVFFNKKGMLFTEAVND